MNLELFVKALELQELRDLKSLIEKEIELRAGAPLYIYNLDLSARLYNGLKRIGITDLRELEGKNAFETLVKIPHVGKKMIDELSRLMIEHNIYFKE